MDTVNTGTGRDASAALRLLESIYIWFHMWMMRGAQNRLVATWYEIWNRTEANQTIILAHSVRRMQSPWRVSAHGRPRQNSARSNARHWMMVIKRVKDLFGSRIFGWLKYKNKTKNHTNWNRRNHYIQPSMRISFVRACCYIQTFFFLYFIFLVFHNLWLCNKIENGARGTVMHQPRQYATKWTYWNSWRAICLRPVRSIGFWPFSVSISFAHIYREGSDHHSFCYRL